MIKIIKDLDIEINSIIEIYNSVGWSNYTDNIESLKKALLNSTYIFGFYEDNKLVGIIRGLTDQVSIHYIQDILVTSKVHNKGIGTQLVQYVMKEYSEVRAHVLLTDDDPSQLAFYKKLKFYNTKELKEFPMNSFVQFNGLELS